MQRRVYPTAMVRELQKLLLLTTTSNSEEDDDQERKLTSAIRFHISRVL